MYQALAEVVGPDFVSDDPAIRQAYSKDVGFPALVRKHKKDPLGVPDLVVLPGSTGEVRDGLPAPSRCRELFTVWWLKVRGAGNSISLLSGRRPGNAVCESAGWS